MNVDRIVGTYKQIIGLTKQNWGKITRNDYLVIAGRNEERRGKVLYRRGIAKKMADQTIEAWR